MNVMSMMIVATAALAVLPTLVAGHAALVTPTAFNSNPSKTMTCGGVSAGPIAYLGSQTSPYTLQWHLIAGDGAGPITMMIDPAGLTTNFPTSYTTTPTGSLLAGNINMGGQSISTVGTTYTFSFTLPAGLTCTGTSGTTSAVCTAQVTSQSNWVACFAFTLAAAPSSGGSTGTSQNLQQGACQTAPTLTACPMITGATVWVQTGADMLQMDASVTATLNQNMNNPNVFINNQDPSIVTPCQTAYINFLCASTFIPCNTAKTQPTTTPFLYQPCQSSCAAFTCWCNLNPIHADLYICSDYQNAAHDLTGNCGRTFGVNNATCIPASHCSTGANCYNGLCSAAPHSAAPMILVGAMALAAAVLFRQ